MTSVALREVASVVRGVSFDKSDVADSPEDGLVPILRAGNIDGELNLIDDLVWVPGGRVSEEQRMRAADIAICMSSGSLSVVGKTAALRHDWSGSVGAFCAIIRPDAGRIEPDFLAFFLKSETFRVWTRQSSGANIKNIRKTELEAFEFNLPSLPEQQRIVDLLSRAEGIVRLRREAQRKVAELVPALFLDMFGDPASNPKRWPVVAFADMADTQLGKMLDKKKQTGLHAFPYLGNSNVRWDDFDLDGLLEMDFSEQERVKFQLMSGDLLACEGGEVGRAAIWRGQMDGCFFQKAIHRIRPKPSSAVPEFILHWLWNMSKQGLLANAGAKATIAHLPAEKLRSLIVALPPIELQRLFANKVEAVRAIAARQATALATAQATFDALLHQAFAARQPG
ncbi:MAG: restriction endonuclease subunit S [Proteobacteria bacterium]|nr:restriction endonuclease subunit S [Pseudomonadota bacterium]